MAPADFRSAHPVADAVVMVCIPLADLVRLVRPMRGRGRGDGRCERGQSGECNDAGENELLDFHVVLSKQMPTKGAPRERRTTDNVRACLSDDD